MLHRTTHRLPGVPAHVDQPAGHQGTPAHGRGWRRDAPRPRRHPSPGRPPWFLPAWQRRVAALFGREL